eukprot:CAMPEP_0206261448 /NCGR_PEP_ID=MMETSP0047_2-20121206/27662_1 /ASSEMBLY_ACC=CAM_ASM_000192 /TAXON_ID=195065 /ORGANISM="Chroomonas mesostigmatica_cf, Strain CCMP1168" /LENGTH=67 /DNA_ID=CAMNT_0053688667 /DNA_START=484 /DNA_END=684 /DNA_ORIENTATION=+
MPAAHPRDEVLAPEVCEPGGSGEDGRWDPGVVPQRDPEGLVAKGRGQVDKLRFIVVPPEHRDGRPLV